MREKWTFDNIPELKDKIIIVTGGNSGLGYESVKAFATKGAEVILASRSKENGEHSRDEILKEFPGATIEVMILDLGDLESVKGFTSEFRKKYNRLDVLLNNAGIMMSPYFRTKDGFEGQMGINHLGHFALTGLLMDILKKTPGSRVVNVTSNAHKRGKMDFNNPLFKNGRDYSPTRAYGRSKLANLLYTYELQRRLERNNSNTLAVAAHPGVAMTNLARYLEKKLLLKLLFPILKWLAQDQASGALPQIRASVDPNVKGGEYYGPDGRNEFKGYPVRVESNAASHDRKDATSLWEESERLTGVEYKV